MLTQLQPANVGDSVKPHGLCPFYNSFLLWYRTGTFNSDWAERKGSLFVKGPQFQCCCWPTLFPSRRTCWLVPYCRRHIYWFSCSDSLHLKTTKDHWVWGTSFSDCFSVTPAWSMQSLCCSCSVSKAAPTHLVHQNWPLSFDRRALLVFQVILRVLRLLQCIP